MFKKKSVLQRLVFCLAEACVLYGGLGGSILYGGGFFLYGGGLCTVWRSGRLNSVRRMFVSVWRRFVSVWDSLPPTLISQNLREIV